MQEAGQRRLLTQIGRVAGQHEKYGLEGILVVVQMPEHAPASTADHRPIATDQNGEGVFIAADKESPQQMLVAVLAATLRSDDVAKAANAGGQRIGS